MSWLAAWSFLLAVVDAHASSPFPSFIGLGDWGGVGLGGTHKANQLAVARQLTSTANAKKSSFVVNTGDNFYYCGILNDTDFQIKADFEDVYTGINLPWYSSLGNHEYGYNVSAQIAYGAKNPNWILPARYYTRRMPIGGNASYISLIVLDTSPCVSKYRASDPSGWDPCNTMFPTCSPVDEGPCEFNKNILTQECSPQLDWFKERLASVPKDDWLIVVGHHPLDQLDVEDFVAPLQARGFDLYLNGHTHLLNQYTLDGKGAYLTTGAGAMVDTIDQEVDLRLGRPGSHEHATQWTQKIAGFTLHTFNENLTQLTTDFISFRGDVVHSFTVTKGDTPSPPAGDTCAALGCGTYSKSSPCACNHACKKHGDCCRDYDAVCGGSTAYFV